MMWKCVSFVLFNDSRGSGYASCIVCGAEEKVRARVVAGEVRDVSGPISYAEAAEERPSAAQV